MLTIVGIITIAAWIVPMYKANKQIEHSIKVLKQNLGD